MTTKQHTALKKRLLSEGRRVPPLKADNARQAMLDVQASANESQGPLKMSLSCSGKPAIYSASCLSTRPTRP